MKIAFTTSGNDLNAPLDSRFGRAPKFLVYDLENESFSVIDNQQNMQARQGAGIQAAGTIVRKGVKGLVTGHCGPKAFQALNAAGVEIYTSTAASVAAALEQYRSGSLTPAATADVDGHW